MKITVAKHSGFCMGVKNAVELALSCGGGNTYILGELIHNPVVNKKLKDKGIKQIESLDEIDSGTIIIRSHGASKAVYEKIKEKGLKLIDSTCIFVKNIHKKVEKYYEEGYQIIIIGDASHPEVQGINGWCNNSAIIYDDEKALDLSNYDKCCIVVQTTYSKDKFIKIIKNIIRDDRKIVEVFDTICYTTVERQKEAQFLSENNDCMIVIGGKSSSNTKKLQEICEKVCKNVYLIEYPNELDINKIKKYNNVAIVAGASTPDELIKEVYFRMEQLVNAGVNAETAGEIKETAEAVKETAEVVKETAEAVEVKTVIAENKTAKITEINVSAMDQALREMDSKENKFRKGQSVKATIALVEDDGLSLAIGSRKSDIHLFKDDIELDGSYDKSKFSAGDVIDVCVTNISPLAISRKQYLFNIQDDALVEELKDGKEFKIIVNGFNKGGLTGKFGSFTLFIPASLIRMGFVKPEEFEKYVGKELRLKLIEIKGKTIIGSAKEIIIQERMRREEARNTAIKAFFESIEIGQVVDGKVVRFTDFGAFVNVNGFDCLAHISDLAWTNVKKAEDILTKDKTYEFVVLKIDSEKQHVSIGYKQLQPKPWDLVAEKYPVGSIVKGKVVRLAPFGAFVEVEPGVDGLVHVSQITHDWIENPASALKVGDDIEAKVIEVKPEAQKLTLSIKALLPAPEVIEPRIKKNTEPEQQQESIGKPREERKFRPERTERRPRAVKKDIDEPHEWSSEDSSGASIGDLLKDFTLDIDNNEDTKEDNKD